MKRALPALLLVALLPLAGAETFLRIRSGAEEYSRLDTNSLPAAVLAPLRARMLAEGWAPYESAARPRDTWCTTWARTLALDEGGWHEGWEEAPIPVPLDRGRLVGTILALPAGTNLLAAALASEPVAAWFAGEPTYIRGSDGAAAVAAALGIDAESLETIAAIAAGRMRTPPAAETAGGAGVQPPSLAPETAEGSP